MTRRSIWLLISSLAIFAAQVILASPTSSPSRAPTRRFNLLTSDELSNVLQAGESKAFLIKFTSLVDASVEVQLCLPSDNFWLQVSPAKLNVTASTQAQVTLNAGVTTQYIESLGLTAYDPATELSGCVQIVAKDRASQEVIYDGTVQLDAAISLPCLAGSFSSTGTNYPQPCEMCPLGTFSTGNRSQACTSCPESRPLTNTMGTSLASKCKPCPLGNYCPIGSGPVPCPANGGYEPASQFSQLKDRFAADCVSKPCEPGYWCGAGAAEGVNYEKLLDFPNVVSVAAVLGQEKDAPIEFVKVLDAGDNLTVVLDSDLPTWLSIPPILNVISTSSDAAIKGTVKSLEFGTSTSAFFDQEKANFTATFLWHPVSQPEYQFPIQVKFDFTLVTVILTPERFQYSTSQRGSSAEISLSPPIDTEIDVFNTMCDYAVTMTIQNTSCTGEPFPAWFKVDDPVFFAGFKIEEQAGLPTTIKFSLESIHLLANSTSLFDPNALSIPEPIPPAVFESTCLKFDFVVNTLNLQVSRQVNVEFRLLRPCPPGSFSLSGDDAEGCNPCPIDTYQESSGQTFCVKCTDTLPRTRQVGTLNHLDCLVDRGRFLYGNSSQPCPMTADCEEEIGLTVRTIALRPGYWRPDPESVEILECPRKNYCHGGRIVSQEELENSLLPTGHADGRRRRRLDYEFGDYVDNQCISNHTGPFCYDCVKGAIKRTAEKICVQCTDSELAQDRGRIAGLSFLFGFLLLSVIIVFFYYTRRFYLIAEGRAERYAFEIRLGKIFTALDVTIPIQILISFLQVISSMSGTFRDVLPPFYEDIRQVFAILALDLVNMIDFGCALAAQNHFSSLLLSTLMPLAFSIVVFIVGYLLQRYAENAVLRQEYRNATMTAFLFTTFLVYPMCSSRILATFVCQGLQNGVTVLATDPSISCTSDVYYSYFYYAIFMVILYPVGIPVLYIILLWKERQTMYQYYSDNVKLAVAMRSNDKDIRYLKFLWRPYKPAYFYFEVFELVRKLAQTSIVVFIAPGSSPQIVFQLLTTVVSVVVLNSLSPYLVYSDGLLALVAQWTLFGISLTTLLIKFNKSALTVSPEYNQEALDALLTVMFFSVPAAAIVRAASQVLGEVVVIFNCVDVDKWRQKYNQWKQGFVFGRKRDIRRRKSPANAAADGENAPPTTRRRKSFAGGLPKSKTSFVHGAIDFAVDETNLLETEEGALKLLELLKNKFTAFEKDFNELLEEERKENEELVLEKQELKADIQILEEELQNMKVRQIQQKEEEEEEKEAARAELGEDHEPIFGAASRFARAMRRVSFSSKSNPTGEQEGAGTPPSILRTKKKTSDTGNDSSAARGQTTSRLKKQSSSTASDGKSEGGRLSGSTPVKKPSSATVGGEDPSADTPIGGRLSGRKTPTSFADLLFRKTRHASSNASNESQKNNSADPTDIEAGIVEPKKSLSRHSSKDATSPQTSAPPSPSKSVSSTGSSAKPPSSPKSKGESKPPPTSPESAGGAPSASPIAAGKSLAKEPPSSPKSTASSEHAARVKEALNRFSEDNVSEML